MTPANKKSAFWGGFLLAELRGFELNFYRLLIYTRCMLKTKYKLYNQYLKSSAQLLLGYQSISSDKIYCLLLNKLYENFKCIDNLITSKFYEQARIILRSNIEIALTYIYLVVFPNKKEEYIQQQDLLKFKNLFIILKDL